MGSKTHQVIKSSSHQVIKSSSHQVIKSSSHGSSIGRKLLHIICYCCDEKYS